VFESAVSTSKPANMPFSLTIGTERATALQVCMSPFLFGIPSDIAVKQSIQDELTRRGYSQDAGRSMRRCMEHDC
jgi:hypothetical protein